MNTILTKEILETLTELTNSVKTNFSNNVNHDDFSKNITENLYYDLIKVIVDHINKNQIKSCINSQIIYPNNFQFERNFNELKTTANYIEYLLLKANGEIMEKKENLNLNLVIEKDILKEKVSPDIEINLALKEFNELMDNFKITKEGKLMHSNFPEAYEMKNYHHTKCVRMKQRPIKNLVNKMIRLNKIEFKAPKEIWRKNINIDVDGFANYIKAFWPKKLNINNSACEEYALEYLKMNNYDIANCIIDISVNSMNFRKYLELKFSTE